MSRQTSSQIPSQHQALRPYYELRHNNIMMALDVKIDVIKRGNDDYWEWGEEQRFHT